MKVSYPETPDLGMPIKQPYLQQTPDQLIPVLERIAVLLEKLVVIENEKLIMKQQKI